MSVEISYRVVNLDRVGPFVKMNLEAVRTVSSEEKEPELDKVDEGKLYQNLDVRPKPKTQMEEVFSAIRTQMPELMEMVKSGPSFPGAPSGVIVRGPVSLFNQTAIFLTPEQYREMGSPPLLSTIQITMCMKAPSS